MNLAQPEAPELAQELLDPRQVGAIAKCSPRHLHRLAESGRMPAPIRLGTLVRWPRRSIEDWIAAGCPRVTPEAKAPRSKEAGRG